MPQDTTQPNPRLISSAWRLYLLLAFAEGVFVLARHLGAKSESEAAILLGFSATRILLGGVILGFVLLLGWLLARSWLNPAWFETFTSRLTRGLAKPRVWGSIMLISLAGLIGGVYLLVSIPSTTDAFTRLLLERLAPVIGWITALCAQNLVLLPTLRSQIDSNRLKSGGKQVLVLGLVVAGLLLLWGWVVKTQFSTESRTLGWNELGAPILETQVFLGWVIGMGVYLLVALVRPAPDEVSRRKPVPLPWLDVFIGLAIWLGTVILWSAVPISANWFVTDPRPPNFAYYPDSDASNYDMVVQKLQIGEGFEFAGLPYIRRPLHGLYLFAVHGIAGQDYGAIIDYQILLLATLPFLIYLLARMLHNRLAGLFAAAFISLREANSIALANRITTSNAKTLLVDLPTTLVVVLFIIVMVAGLRANDRKPVYFLAGGGLLGALVLLRPEMSILFIPTILILLLVFWKRSKLFFKGLGLFILGGVLVLSPWIWRNWQITGRILVGEDPSFRIFSILERYQEQIPVQPTPTPENSPAMVLPPKNNPGMSASLMPVLKLFVPVITTNPGDDPGPTPVPPATIPSSGDPLELLGKLSSFMKDNAGQLGQQFLAQYMNSQMQMILVLPTTLRMPASAIGYLGNHQTDLLRSECCSVTSYIQVLPYWRKWDGQFKTPELLLLVLNVALIGLGLQRAWKKEKVIGLVPLIYALTHLLTNAVFRNSGGRYILPLDWTGVLYFSMGLAFVSQWSIGLFAGSRLQSRLSWVEDSSIAPNDLPNRPVWRSVSFYALAAGLFLLGCSMVVVERSIPQRYTDQDRESKLQAVLQSDRLSTEERQRLDLAIRENGVVEAGRALYPRYIRPKDHEFSGKTEGENFPYRRMVFEVVGPANRSVILPLDAEPEVFPHASDVLLIVDSDGQVLAVGVFENEGRLLEILLRSQNQP